MFTTQRVFIHHAVSLRQAFAHCGRFLTAASRRSMGRVSVPFWLVVLSDQLPVIALVSHYLTNKLIGRELIRKRLATLASEGCPPWPHAVLIQVSLGYPPLPGMLSTCYAPVRH